MNTAAMTTPAAAAKRVIVIVFDGLRPDLVTAVNTPNILRVAARGTWFRQARSVFPSVTRVATSSIATGATPARHGIMGNAFYLPAVFTDKIFDTAHAANIRAAESATGGQLIDCATFGDQLAKANRQLMVVHAGSAGSAHAINPRAASNGHWTFSILGADATSTPDAVRECIIKFGVLPGKELPKLRDQDYATTVMVEHVLPQKPDVALVWFNEPDTSFHYLEIGSEGSLLALRNADAGLGRILDWVEAQPDADDICVIVASDHGQISTSAALPLFDQARNAGMVTGRGDKLDGAEFYVTTGCSGEIRSATKDQAALTRMVDWLMQHPDVSHVFSRARNEVEGEIAGTLSLASVGHGHARSPDLMYVLRSDVTLDRRGLPGMGLLMPGDVAPGGGYHGGLNPHELNTVLIISAPGNLAAGVVSQETAGIIDIAPTILDLAGAEKAHSMQGRSLVQPAREAASMSVFETGTSQFSQKVVTSVHEGRSILQHGGHLD